ncbi:MAG: hypothetical protein Q4C03_06650, partial [bacterium]|nr:hypothetical protein [bacterium]
AKPPPPKPPNTAALTALAAAAPTSTEAEAARRENRKQYLLEHNRKQALAAHRRRREHLRDLKDESDFYRLSLDVDKCVALGIPVSGLGLWLVRNFTPLFLTSGRLVWLQLYYPKNRYPASPEYDVRPLRLH